MNESKSALDGIMRDGRHLMTVRVYYEDTDFSGIVYHANYLRFMERGRTNHLRLMGAEQHTLFAEAETETPGFAFVVRSMTLDFLKPARMDDVLDVVTWPLAVKGASITFSWSARGSLALSPGLAATGLARNESLNPRCCRTGRTAPDRVRVLRVRDGGRRARSGDVHAGCAAGSRTGSEKAR